MNILDSLGFPVESYELVGLEHTDEWITDANTPFPDTSGSTPDVRARLREWLDETMTDMPGTHSVSGLVRDSLGQPVVGARIQSGDTHWTYTDENGLYELAGLIDSNRTVTVSHDGFEFLDPWVNVVVDGADVGSVNFVATPEPSAFLLLSLGGAGFACGCRRSR